jgi:hypothetical protein
MSPERKQRILDMIHTLEEAGTKVTVSSIYGRVMGHRPDVTAVLQEWRAAQLPAGRAARAAAAATLDEEPDEGSFEALSEDLEQLKEAYDAWHAEAEHLWALETEGADDEHVSARLSHLERVMQRNLTRQQAIQPQLDAARLAASAAQGKRVHDAGIPQAEALIDLIVGDLVQVSQRMQALEYTFDAQIDPLVTLRSRRGDQAFSLASGREICQSLMSTLLAGDGRAQTVCTLLLDLNKVVTTLTVGSVQNAKADCARLKPFSLGALRRYVDDMSQYLAEAYTS